MNSQTTLGTDVTREQNLPFECQFRARILPSSDSGSRQGPQGFAIANAVNGNLEGTELVDDWCYLVLDMHELSEATRDGRTFRYLIPNQVAWAGGTSCSWNDLVPRHNPQDVPDAVPMRDKRLG